MSNFWNRRPLWQKLLAIFLTSLIPVFSGLASGIASDCSSGQRDGQCGLSTFVGLLNGLAIGGIVLILGSIVIVVQWWRAVKRTEAK
jgi:hypothetical protein